MSESSSDKFVHVGGPVDAVRVSLRIFGNALEPNDITARLGRQPTAAYRKGEIVVGKVTKQRRERRSGAWFLKSALPENQELELHVKWILDQLTSDFSVWQSIQQEFDADIFCGLFLDEENRGFGLSSAIMRALADRQLQIGFDIYGPGDVLKGMRLRPPPGE